MEKMTYNFPKMHIIMIVNPLATTADIKKFSKQYGKPNGKDAYPIWRTPDMPAGKCSIRCAVRDDISNEYKGLYED